MSRENGLEAQPIPVELETKDVEAQRRALLKKVARYAAVTAPVVTLLLAGASKPRRALAASPLPESSRQFKRKESAVDLSTLLSAAMTLPAKPGAGDFRTAFGVGDDTKIDNIDAAGVCLAAIRALAARVAALEPSIRGSVR